MEHITAAMGNADPGETFEIIAALEKSLGAAPLRQRLRSYVASADRLVAALEAAGAGGNWHAAARLAEGVAASARELGFRAMCRAAGNFDAEVRRGCAPHTLRNNAQMVVVEHEHLRMVVESLHPGWMA
jgi:hypothetical protein